MNKKAFEKGYRDSCSRCGVDPDALFKYAEAFTTQDAIVRNNAPAPLWNGMQVSPLSTEWMELMRQTGGNTSNTTANPVASSTTSAQQMAPDPAPPEPPPTGRSFTQRLSGAVRPAVDSASAAGNAVGGVGKIVGKGLADYIDMLAGTPASELRSGIANPNTRYMDTPENRAKLIALDEATSRARLGTGGAIGGAALGGGLGAMVGGKKRRALGAFIGALAGGAAGSTLGMV